MYATLNFAKYEYQSMKFPLLTGFIITVGFFLYYYWNVLYVICLFAYFFKQKIKQNNNYVALVRFHFKTLIFHFILCLMIFEIFKILLIYRKYGRFPKSFPANVVAYKSTFNFLMSFQFLARFPALYNLAYSGIIFIAGASNEYIFVQHIIPTCVFF